MHSNVHYFLLLCKTQDKILHFPTHTNRTNWKQHLQFNYVYQKHTTVVAESVMCYYTVGISQETWLTYSTWLFHSPSYRSAKICLTSSPHDYVLLPPPNTDIAACWESCLWCDSAPSTHVSLTALQICWQWMSASKGHMLRNHTTGKYNDLGWHYSPVQLHTEIIEHNRQRWISTSDLNSYSLSHSAMVPGNSGSIHVNHKSGSIHINHKSRTINQDTYVL